MKKYTLNCMTLSSIYLISLIPFACCHAWSLDLSSGVGKNFIEEAGRDPYGRNPISEKPDNSIDPDTYLVGGGDGFQISIVGLPSQAYFPVINHDGDLFIGDFGIIKIGKVSLSKALHIIRQHVQKTLRRNNEVYVTLVRVKKVTLTMSGDIAVPGTMEMNGTMRILDAVKMANRGILPPFEKYDFRNISRRQGDSIQTFDLLRALANLDLSQNPYVYPGDNLMLNPIDQAIYVKGEISSPFEGKLPLRRGETLGDLLGMISLKASADSNYIHLQQFGEDGNPLPRRKISFSDAPSVKLGDRDVITIGRRENYLRPATATVSGEAVRSGTFPILAGATAVSEVLQLAGGARQGGNLQRAYVVKTRIYPGSKEWPLGKGNPYPSDSGMPNQKDAALAALRKVRPEMNVALTDLNTTKDYMILDFAEGGNAVPLEDGDRIHIPRKTNFVYVSGTVGNPGPYLFKEGKPFDYYIDQAGGYSAKSDRKNAFVLTMYEDISKIKDRRLVGEGDILVVPSSVEYKTFSTVWVPILQTIPSIISLGLSIYIVHQQMN